jgi:hypothetical protein
MRLRSYLPSTSPRPFEPKTTGRNTAIASKPLRYISNEMRVEIESESRQAGEFRASCLTENSEPRDAEAKANLGKQERWIRAVTHWAL